MIRNLLKWLRSPPLQPFPDGWASFLWDQSAHYRRLPARLRDAFERDVQRFIATHRITGIKVEVDERLQLLVAASAATLSLGWPVYKWSEVSEVLLYPDSFDRDFTIGGREIAGIADVWGTVILSVPALWHSFRYDEDAYHLGFHEFAHLLTFERGRGSGIPVGLAAKQVQMWEGIQSRELERIARGESVVEAASMQTWEFFPSAVEAFFQKPMALREAHPTLYAFLRRYFRQNPALWESRSRDRSPGQA